MSTIIQGIADERVIEVGTLWQEALIHLFWIMHSAEVDDSGDGKKAFSRAEDHAVCKDVVDGIFELLEQNEEGMRDRLHEQLLNLAKIHAVETGYDSGKEYSVDNIAEESVREHTKGGGLSMQFAFQMFTSTMAERIITQIQLEQAEQHQREHEGIEGFLGMLMQGMSDEPEN